MNCLGIDYGTTSVKAVLFNDRLEPVVSAVRDYTLRTSGNTVEFDPASYRRMLTELVDEVSSQAEIGCLAVDTQCETLILTDENGVPVRDAIVWLDNRADSEAQEIEAKLTRRRIYEVTGQPEVTATWPACKLLWVRRHEPEVWARTKKIFLLEDYLLYCMTGRFVTEKTLQSSSLYFDIRTGGWWQEMLDLVGIGPAMLPELLDSGVPVGSFRGITVSTSAMDQVAGAIGAGVVRPGIVSEMTGTTMAVFVPSDTVPPYDPDSIVPCHYNFNGKYCLLSWSPTAGMALKWFRNAFCSGTDFSELDRLAEQAGVGSGGVTFLPYLCGSTMPKYNPDARGSFTGLTPEHGKGHFARSIMEAVSCLLKDTLDHLAVPVTEIRAMGGGARSPFWCRMKADMTGKTLVTLKQLETACLGAAILAGVGAGLFPSVTEACSGIETDRVFAPSGTDYTEVCRRFHAYDELLNIRGMKI